MHLKNALIILLSLCLLFSCASKDSKKESEKVNVKAQKVGFSTTSFGVGYSGTIEESSGSQIGFSSAGTIASINVKEGQMVSKGQTLATLEASTQENMLLSMESASDMAKETLSQAEDAYKRMKMLHDEGSIPDIQWVDIQTKLAQARSEFKASQAQVEIAKKGVQDTHLVAPFSGYISSKIADQGQQVAPGVPVLSIVNINRVKAKISVPEKEISSIREGQEMTILVSTLEDERFQGYVTEKGVSADPVSRTYNVWVTLDNPSHKLLPGMLCEVIPTYKQTENLVAIDAKYILIDENNNRFVWCISNSKATRKFVKTGKNIGQKVVILEGLTSQDTIITQGSQKVAQGSLCNIEK